MRIFFCLLYIILAHNCLSQLQDNFNRALLEEGDIVWETGTTAGVTGSFQIIKNELQSVFDNGSGTRKAWISTAILSSTRNYIFEWYFKARLDFSNLSASLSDRNKCRIYLAAIGADLNENPEGYFVECKPVAGEDSMSCQLYYSLKGEEVLLGSSTDIIKVPSFIFAEVKVRLGEAGFWEIWINDNKQGEGIDLQLPVSGYFGAQVFFSSGAREDKFFFDDFSIIKYPFLDTLTWLSNRELLLEFSVPVDENEATQTDNYLLNNIVNPFVVVVEGKQVKLQFENTFPIDEESIIQVESLLDTAGNALPTGKILSTKFIYKAPDTSPPEIISVLGLQDSLINVQFNEPISDASIALEDFFLLPDNLIPVFFEADTANSYLLHFEKAFKIDSVYQVSVKDISDLQGNILEDTISKAFVFQDRVHPVPQDLQLVNSNTLLVTFSEAVDKLTAIDTNHYQWSDNMQHPEWVILKNDKQVKLFFSQPFPENSLETLVISNVEDIFQNRMPEIWQGNFVYDTEKPTVATSGSVIPLSDRVLQIIFSEAVETVSARIVNNYLLSFEDEQAIPNEVTLDSARANIVYLAFEKPFISERTYNLKISQVADKVGNIMNTRNRKFEFDIRPPFVTDYRFFPESMIKIIFNEIPNIDPEKDTANFNLLNSFPSKLESLSGEENIVFLYYDSMPLGNKIPLLITEIEDFQGNKMPSTDTLFINTVSPEIAQLDVISKNTLRLTLSMQVDTLPNTALQNYQINSGYFPDSISIQDNIITLTFPISFAQDTIYQLQINTITATSGKVNSGLIEAFHFQNPLETAYIKDDYQVVLNYNKALFPDSLKPTQFILNGILQPLRVFQDENDLSILTLLFETVFIPDTLYQLATDYIKQIDGKIAPAYRVNLQIDKTNPVVQRAAFEGFHEIRLVFSEKVDKENTLAFNHYQLSDGTANYSPIATDVLFDSIVILRFEPTFLAETNYELTLNNILDRSGNMLVEENIVLEFPRIPGRGTLVISEIMADPTPSVGLPEAEYIEIWNTSLVTQNLLHLYLKDEVGETHLGNYEIQPSEFVIICDDAFENAFKAFGQVKAISSFPSITNSGEKLSLVRVDNIVIDEVNFQDSWYRDTNKKEGGWSVERILPDYDCTETDNWRASNEVIGGSPGLKSSVEDSIPDSILPEISAVSQLDEREVLLTFSEKMDTVLTDIDNNFLLNASTSPLSISWKSSDSLMLLFEKELAQGIIHEIEVSGLNDCAENSMLTKTIFLAKGKQPDYHEVIISEIMADPEPSAGLPEFEYVEIYNRTNQLLDLTGCTLSDATSTINLNGFITPYSYLILCSSAAAPFFRNDNVQVISGFPSLNNTGERLQISNALDEQVFSITYSDDWYRDSDKSEGGYALEIIDVDFPCGEEENWEASQAEMGGTPGNENSVKNIVTDNIPPNVENVFIEDSLTLRLIFNEKMDSLSVVNASYTLTPQINIDSIKIVGEGYEQVILSLADPLSLKVIYQVAAKNMQDCSGNTANAFSIEAFVLPEIAGENDVLLSEILFNPLPNGVDFVELYNPSAKYIDLKEWKLANGKGDLKTIAKENFIFKPSNFLVLTAERETLQSFYPALADTLLIEMDMPSFNDDEGNVYLLNPLGDTVQLFSYHEDLHLPLLDEVEGVSLERIDYTLAVDNIENWHSAAASVNYATPGKRNSQSALLSSKQEECFSIQPEIFSPDLDGVDDFATIYFDCQTPGTIANVSVFDAKGRLIKSLIQNQSLSSEGFFRWDGTKDNGERAAIGYYIVLIEAFDLDGNLQQEKLKIALGGRF